MSEKTYSSVWALPHLLQLEFFHAGLIRGDGRAFDTDVVLQYGIGRVDGDLVVGLREDGRIEDSRKANERPGIPMNTKNQNTYLVSVF